MKKNEINTVLLIGGIAGAFLLFKGLKGGITSLFTGLAQSLNLAETETEKQTSTQFAVEPQVNAWNPNYWKILREKNPSKQVQLMSIASADRISKDCYDSIYKWLPVAPDGQRVLGAFSKIKYKSQVSFLAEYFEKKYQRDLLTYLDNGEPFFVGNTGLPDQSMRKLLTYVNSLPSGII